MARTPKSTKRGSSAASHEQIALPASRPLEPTAAKPAEARLEQGRSIPTLALDARPEHRGIEESPHRMPNGDVDVRLVFGSVEVTVRRSVSDPRWAKNVRAGQEALAGATKVLSAPGVELGLKAKIPKYHVDAKGRLIRVLGRKREIVELVNGKFLRV